MNKEILVYNRKNSKKGVAIFFVLFVIVILGTLFAAFYSSSRQAQNSVFLFQSSETARQLAAAAQEEAFRYLNDITNNSSGKDFNQLNDIQKEIINRNNILMSGVNRNQKGIELDVSETKKIADSRLDISAVARIVDFRNKDFDGHVFLNKECIGTIEIAVTVKPKEKYKKQFPGSCTMICHHDYKVVSILSKAENRVNEEGDEVYAGNSVLDYVLFVRKGQEEFEIENSKSLNPDIKLDINAEGDVNYLGKVNFGSGKEKFTYLNISKKTENFVSDINKDFVLGEATGSDFLSIFPIYQQAFENAKAQAEADVKKAIEDEGATCKKAKAEISGYKVIFHQKKLAVTDDCISGELKGIRAQAAQIAINKESKPVNCDNFFDGISIEPKNELRNILKCDLRKQYLNYAYMVTDFSNLKLDVDVTYEYRKGLKKKKENKHASDYFNLENNTFTCYDEDLGSEGSKQIDNNYLRNYIKTNFGDEKGFTQLNDKYAFVLPENNESQHIPNQEIFFNKYFDKLKPPSESCYPYAHFNLFIKKEINKDKTSDSEDELKELGILKDNVLTLKGIVHCSNPVTLGNIKVKGCGVLIARGITINGKIEKDSSNPDSVCVLFSRNGDITINTDEEINAALIAMYMNPSSYKHSNINVNGTLNLKGSLATDFLNLHKWKQGVTHKINYDKSLIPNKDIYQINISKWVSFERVIEKE